MSLSGVAVEIKGRGPQSSELTDKVGSVWTLQAEESNNFRE